ncbi:MAG TPA: cytochrome c [Candidatus Angelobacter sp.]|nr:cytochrome c [Candidatus Angelobacter sp.]
MNFPKNLWFRATAAFLFLLAVAAVVYGVHIRRAATTKGEAPSVRKHENLAQLMKAEVHEQYTALSFTIWHDPPLTQPKMQTIAVASAHIMQTTGEIAAFRDDYREQGWSKEDLKFFEEENLQLFRVAQELNRAAQKQSEADVTHLFVNLDNTCQSCHKKFRPALAWS